MSNNPYWRHLGHHFCLVAQFRCHGRPKRNSTNTPPWCSLSHHVLGLIRQVPTMTDIENQPSVFRLLCFGVRWPVENITENDERSRYYITTIENNTKLNLQRIPRCFRKLGEKFATIWNTAEWSRKTEKKTRVCYDCISWWFWCLPSGWSGRFF